MKISADLINVLVLLKIFIHQTRYIRLLELFYYYCNSTVTLTP